MGPHGTFHFVEEKLGSNQNGPEQQCISGGGSSTEISGQLASLASDARSSACSSARRNKVYDNIMRQWEKAASSMVPMPRSSHRRVLGGQALPTRQVSVDMRRNMTNDKLSEDVMSLYARYPSVECATTHAATSKRQQNRLIIYLCCDSSKLIVGGCVLPRWSALD